MGGGGAADVRIRLKSAELSGPRRQEVLGRGSSFAWAWALGPLRGATRPQRAATAFSETGLRVKARGIPTADGADGVQRCVAGSAFTLRLTESDPAAGWERLVGANATPLDPFRVGRGTYLRLRFQWPEGGCELALRLKVSVSPCTAADESPGSSVHRGPSTVPSPPAFRLDPADAAGCEHLLEHLEDPSDIFVVAEASGDEAAVLRAKYREMAAAKLLLERELERLALEENRAVCSILSTQAMHSSFTECLRLRQQEVGCLVAAIARPAQTPPLPPPAGAASPQPAEPDSPTPLPPFQTLQGSGSASEERLEVAEQQQQQQQQQQPQQPQQQQQQQEEEQQQQQQQEEEEEEQEQEQGAADNVAAAEPETEDGLPDNDAAAEQQDGTEEAELPAEQQGAAGDAAELADLPTEGADAHMDTQQQQPDLATPTADVGIPLPAALQGRQTPEDIPEELQNLTVAQAPPAEIWALRKGSSGAAAPP